MEETKSKKSIWIIVIIVLIVILAVGGYFLYDKVIKQDTTNTNTLNSNKNSNTTDDDTNEIEEGNNTGQSEKKYRMDVNCPDSSCNKEIGIVNLDNKNLSLKVDLQNLNSNNISGTISLGDKSIDVTTLDQTSFETIDGFGTYDKYLIIYSSSKETILNEESNCEIRGYSIQLLDSDLNKVSGLTGYTKNNALDDFFISEDDLYYFALKSDATDAAKSNVTFNKIKFSELVNKNYDKAELISTTLSC